MASAYATDSDSSCPEPVTPEVLEVAYAIAIDSEVLRFDTHCETTRSKKPRSKKPRSKPLTSFDHGRAAVHKLMLAQPDVLDWEEDFEQELSAQVASLLDNKHTSTATTTATADVHDFALGVYFDYGLEDSRILAAIEWNEALDETQPGSRKRAAVTRRWKTTLSQLLNDDALWSLLTVEDAALAYYAQLLVK